MATIDNYTINIAVKGDADIKSATASSDKLGKSISSIPLKELADQAGTASSAIRSMGEHVNVLKEKAEMLGTALVGVGIIEFIKSISESASEVKDLSEAFGLSITSVLELEAGFVRAGKSTGDMAKMLTTLDLKAIEMADDINGKAAGAFKTLGVTFDDLKTKAPKDILLQIADAMIKANGDARAVAASLELLGKSAKGLPMGDLAEGIRKATGSMGEAEGGVRAFDEASKNLQANLMAVKRELMTILAPAVEFFNTLTGGSNKARAEAEILAGVLAVITGAAVLKGFAYVIEAVKGLSVAFGVTTAASSAAAITTTVLMDRQAQSAAASIIQAAGLGRVATATVAVNVATDRLTKLQSAGSASALEMAAAETALATAQSRLATMTEAAALAQTQLNASQLVGAGAGAAAMVTTMRTGWEAIGFAIGAATMRVGAFLAAAAKFAGVIALIEGINLAAEKVFGQGPIDYFADKLERLVKDTFPKLHSAMESLGSTLGMAPGKLGTPEATAGATGPLDVHGPSAQDKAILENRKQQLDQQAALVMGMRQQMMIQDAMLDRAAKRLALEISLVSASDVEKAKQLSMFDVESKRQQEELRIRAEIAKVTTERNNTEEGLRDKFNGQLRVLNEQLNSTIKQKDQTSALVVNLKEAQDREQARVYFMDLQVKAQNVILGIREQIANFGRSEDDQRIAALNEVVRLEQEAAIKRRQNQLGATPISDTEKASIEKKVADAYRDQLGAVKDLNSALKEHNELILTRDLENKTIEETIRLEAELRGLTMTSDQQRVLALQTQIQLEAQAEIAKRNARLAPGEKISSDEEAAVVKKIQDAYKAIGDATQRNIEASREFSAGWEKAFNQYADDANNAAKRAGDMFGAIMNDMNSAIDNFVETGKFSFSDFASSVIKDLIKIELKSSAMQLFSSAKGLFGGGGGPEQLSGPTDSGGGFFSSIASMFGFAGGGDPPVGRPSIVGENGPEVFIPKTAGTIMPNSAAFGNSTTNNITNVTNNVSAVDGQSVARLFTNNRQLLLGTVEQARKETPMRGMARA